MSFPTRERGLKYKSYQRYKVSLLSFPTRERGLKLSDARVLKEFEKSFPTRERGLKCPVLAPACSVTFVVPHAGTWIEINTAVKGSNCIQSFPTRERGLKFSGLRSPDRREGRSPRGNMD